MRLSVSSFMEGKLALMCSMCILFCGEVDEQSEMRSPLATFSAAENQDPDPERCCATPAQSTQCGMVVGGRRVGARLHGTRAHKLWIFSGPSVRTHRSYQRRQRRPQRVIEVERNCLDPAAISDGSRGHAAVNDAAAAQPSGGGKQLDNWQSLDEGRRKPHEWCLSFQPVFFPPHPSPSPPTCGATAWRGCPTSAPVVLLGRGGACNRFAFDGVGCPFPDSKKPERGILIASGWAAGGRVPTAS